ncbi:mycofactocin biosynthesis peptidyl-dipeptidase MftE [Nocardioides pocheonensis]|uniref:Mycofactocin biosynthesis peptidyl-dipeptidase MftE n=1 Tax=Nocardioides pocheonensis TaxID=661485 RepID=A0A3N0GJ66_9ACTN|nr:mycofactocin biosynthesis peptidyl-dipeptidase MftE [Nocardioides pocheonensis]RNM12158.1 mycofactocin biosynthesis peptidyl-dipeptidase MftE [Nocardioides pocheonensis]
MAPLLAAITSTAATGTELVLVPVGSVEQHGPHLPLDTDTVIAEAVTHRAAAKIPGAVVAPAIAYGSSGEHQTFPGTSSIGTAALQHLLVELTRSVRTWARQVVFVNGHGGNMRALTAAVDQLVAEGHEVAWVPCCVPGSDAHAGRTETSLMLHLRPGSVDRTRAAPGNTAPLDILLPVLVSDGVGAVSGNGVLGDPTGASSAEGRHLLDVMVHRVLEAVAGVRC